MASMKFFLAVILCLAVSANAQTLDPTRFTCPTGWIPNVSDFRSTAVMCAPDPCFGACGTGNTCTSAVQGISGFNFPVNFCQCKAPTVLSQVVYRQFCFVPGTTVCNPSPCKNGSPCEVLTDFNGLPGAYQCNNCPSNFYGRNCDIPGPIPTPTPKNMPPGGSNPYTMF